MGGHVQGAEHILDIEPETNGSTSGTLSRFRKVIKDLNLSKTITAEPKFLQDIQV